jgi:hypothetical protein
MPHTPANAHGMMVRFCGTETSIRGGLTAECSLAGQHLIQHRAKRPDICAAVAGFSGGLFRGHVGGSSQDHAHAGRTQCHRRRTGQIAARWTGVFNGFRQSKVEQLYRPFGSNSDVGRFEIAMNDTALVSVLQGVRHLLRIAQSDVDWQSDGSISTSTSSITSPRVPSDSATA